MIRAADGGKVPEQISEIKFCESCPEKHPKTNKKEVICYTCFEKIQPSNGRIVHYYDYPGVGRVETKTVYVHESCPLPTAQQIVARINNLKRPKKEKLPLTPKRMDYWIQNSSGQ